MPIIKVFRRFRSNNISPKQAITEISNLVPGSNVELSERSSAAPLTSKRPIRKKVTSADRRVLLESFVNKYRAMNQGKFPSPTNAQKEVGGSYYIIRKMLQEMEYNVRISFEEKGLVTENKKLTKNREITVELFESQEESNNQVTINQQLCEDPLLESKREDTINRDIAIESSGSQDQSNDQVTISQQLCEDHLLESKGEDSIHRETVIESSGIQVKSNSQVTTNQQLYEDRSLDSISNFDKKFELKEGLQVSTSNTDTGNSDSTKHDTHNIATKSDDINGQCHQTQELQPKDEPPSEDKFVFEDSRSEVEKQHGDIRNITRDMPEQQKDDELREKPSLWGNLKSMATEFFNMWKK